MQRWYPYQLENPRLGERCKMKTIYLVCENVDLGYNVVKAYTEELAAIRHAKHLDTQHRKDKVIALMKKGYDQASAEVYAECMLDEFYVDTTTLIE
jgi:hypothetical protein